MAHLTDHEIRELDKRDLWGDWNAPDPDLIEPEAGTKTGGRGKRSRRTGTAGSAALAEAEALMKSVID